MEFSKRFTALQKFSENPDKEEGDLYNESLKVKCTSGKKNYAEMLSLLDNMDETSLHWCCMAVRDCELVSHMGIAGHMILPEEEEYRNVRAIIHWVCLSCINFMCFEH